MQHRWAEELSLHTSLKRETADVTREKGAGRTEENRKMGGLRPSVITELQEGLTYTPNVSFNELMFISSFL